MGDGQHDSRALPNIKEDDIWERSGQYGLVDAEK
jgi:hypothetical protein